MNTKLRLGLVVGLASALVVTWRARRATEPAFSAEYEAIHDAVRLNPEAVWPRVRVLLQSPKAGRNADYERQDLIEDIMFWHSEAFIDRLEELVAESPRLENDIAFAHVGGVGVGPGLERYYALQERIAARLEGEGKLTRWKGQMPFSGSFDGTDR